LPALLAFYLASFLFIDKKMVRRLKGISYSVLLLAFIQCAIEVVMLI
jgi:hypothetical protein